MKSDKSSPKNFQLPLPPSNGEVSSPWDFQTNEKEVIENILEKWKSTIFSWLVLGILNWTTNSKDIIPSLQSAERSFVVFDSGKKPLLSYEVSNKIKEVTWEVSDILKNTKMYTVKGISAIQWQLRYHLYIYWVIELLKYYKAFKDKKNTVKRLKDVPDSHAQEIYNIFQDNSLTTLFVVLKAQGILDYSKNPVNEFEKERELKILNIDKDQVINKIKELWWKELYDWEDVKIHDTYYDFPWLSLDRKWKRSLRVRKIKFPDWKEEYFYTIKRKSEKKEDNKARVCYEKEFKIEKFKAFEQILLGFWLVKSREKEKKRTSYYIELEKGKKVKFDIDIYDWIPTLLEIEWDKDEVIEEYKNLLGLQENTTLTLWSRWLFEHYEKKEWEYISHYKTQKFKSWGTKIIWKNWNVVYLNKNNECYRIKKLVA